MAGAFPADLGSLEPPEILQVSLALEIRVLGMFHREPGYLQLPNTLQSWTSESCSGQGRSRCGPYSSPIPGLPRIHDGPTPLCSSCRGPRTKPLASGPSYSLRAGQSAGSWWVLGETRATHREEVPLSFGVFPVAFNKLCFVPGKMVLST